MLVPNGQAGDPTPLIGGPLPILCYSFEEGRLLLFRAACKAELNLRPHADSLVRYMAVRNNAAGAPVLCSYAELIDAVWGPTDPPHTTSELARLIWEIRRELRRLRAPAEELVETEAKRGYRLHTQAEQQAAPAEQPATPVQRPARWRVGKVRRAALAFAVLAGLALGLVLGLMPGLAGTQGRFMELSLPDNGSRPMDITIGPGGDLWFTEYAGNRIGRISRSGELTQYPIPTPHSGPEGIATGPDNTVWFAESNANRIGRIAGSGSIVQFVLPRPNSGPVSVTSGPGGAIWFTEAAHRIGRITPAGALRELPLPADMVPGEIVTVADGNLWFDEPFGGLRETHAVGRMTPSGQLATFSLPTAASSPDGIVGGPDGSVWVSEAGAGQIARIAVSGLISEIRLPTSDCRPADLAVAADGSLWFTETVANKIGRIGPDGDLSEFTVPTPNSGPHGIAVAPDGSVWFTEIEADKIGRLRPPD